MQLSQADLERSTLTMSAERIRAKIERSEQAGRAHENPYAQPLYRRWVLPLRDMIETTLKEEMKKAGRRQAHVALLKPLDATVAAFVAVRVSLAAVAAEASGFNARSLASAIGTALHRELVLSVFENIEPSLFYEVTNDLDRRHSKSERHRYAALMGAARNKNVELPGWQKQDREQLGMWFVEALRVLGLLEVTRVKRSNIRGIKEIFVVEFTDEALRVMGRVKELVELNTPATLPCVEPPKDWVSFDDGGWHTQEMRRVMPFCVNVRRVRNTDLLARIKKSNLAAHVLPAINHLQRVRWAINTGMLDTVIELSKSTLDLEEALSEKGPDAPERPEWLAPAGEKQTMTEEQEAEFKRWKREMARFYTERKLRGQRWSRFDMAVRIANKFKACGAIYFVYQADFRGRLYAQTTGISPQGSDLQKSLLHFADGKPLADEAAIRWFKINGANRFGVDKVPYADRVKWVDDNDKFIIAFADDPINHDEWRDADSPLQFLAWAKEYAAWRRSPQTFLSRIPVGLDGSCNGLQHFSAMLRDVVGGKATNLVPGDKPNDIYAQVAGVTQRKLTDLKSDDLVERDRVIGGLWLKHGINRKLVKRSVMTLPYGSTRYSCAEFIVSDYLRHGQAEEFEPAQYTAAANFLSHPVWESIGEVVVAASTAMAWLQKCARSIIADGQQQIEWTTPSGFPITQVYNEREEVRINAKLFGGCRLWVQKEIDEPRLNGHKNGLAPNFVHSMDASHLTLTVNACESAGITSLAMIHDDYGTHAADTQQLFELIRETFVEMYEKNDPIMDFYRSYDGLPPPPQRGTLDLRAVIESPYFFG